MPPRSRVPGREGRVPARGLRRLPLPAQGQGRDPGHGPQRPARQLVLTPPVTGRLAAGQAQLMTSSWSRRGRRSNQAFSPGWPMFTTRIEDPSDFYPAACRHGPRASSPRMWPTSCGRHSRRRQGDPEPQGTTAYDRVKAVSQLPSTHAAYVFAGSFVTF
jgi:hypothetical protein